MNTVTMRVPTDIGVPFAGGFYAGRIHVNDDVFALIVASSADGQSSGKWNDDTKAVDGAGSYFDGLANTDAMAAAGSKLAQWARALRIADYDDWYLPSRDELDLLHGNFRPGTHATEAFVEEWHWSSTQYASGSDCAWYQGFGGDGRQNDYPKSAELRARAVRRVPVCEVAFGWETAPR